MTADVLLGEFDRICEASDAIPHLRRFILDLAVRGKLVPQDSSDEPASELLKRIAAEKARSERDGEGRKSIQRAPVPEEDSPFELPPLWKWSRLSDIGWISPRNEADNSLEASFVPMTLIPAEYGMSHRHEVRPWGEIRSGYTHFSEGDVGLAKITPCFENGKSTVFENLSGGIGAGTTELHIVRPIQVVARYVLLFLKSPTFMETGIPRMTGTAGQKRVPSDYFANTPFPLPPLAEQRRIVAKVDELMALCDQLEAARNAREEYRDKLVAASLYRFGQPAGDVEADRSDARFTLDHLAPLATRPEHIKQLRQAILNLAVRGKLVPKETGHTLEFERLGSVATLQNGYAFKSEWFVSEGIRLLRNVNVGHGVLRWNESVCLPARLADEYERFRLIEGDIVVSLDRPFIVTGTKVARVRKADLPCLLLQRVGRFQLNADRICTDYLFLWLQSPHFTDQIDPGRSNGVPHVSSKQIEGAEIFVPPLAEQHRIVAKVDELMALCDQLETQLVTTQSESRRLLEAALHEALGQAV